MMLSRWDFFSYVGLVLQGCSPLFIEAANVSTVGPLPQLPCEYVNLETKHTSLAILRLTTRTILAFLWPNKSNMSIPLSNPIQLINETKARMAITDASIDFYGHLERQKQSRQRSIERLHVSKVDEIEFQTTLPHFGFHVNISASFTLAQLRSIVPPEQEMSIRYLCLAVNCDKLLTLDNLHVSGRLISPELYLKTQLHLLPCALQRTWSGYFNCKLNPIYHALHHAHQVSSVRVEHLDLSFERVEIPSLDISAFSNLLDELMQDSPFGGSIAPMMRGFLNMIENEAIREVLEQQLGSEAFREHISQVVVPEVKGMMNEQLEMKYAQIADMCSVPESKQRFRKAPFFHVF